MKKLALTLTIAGTALTLSACGTGRGNVDTQAPYEMERTASHSNAPAYRVEADVDAQPVRAERTFRRMQTK